MKASEYFGDWMDVIDTVELRRILSWVSTIDKTTLCPSSPNIFKAFIEITEWHNGEGWDIAINERMVSLTWGQLEAIKYLIKSLEYKD